MSTGSLLTNDVLLILYQEAQGHDIEYKAKNFWQNLIIQEFPPNRRFTVNSEWSPDGQSRTRVDLCVGLVSHQYHHTLLLLEAKRTGQGAKPIKEVEEQLKRAAKTYLQSYRSQIVYGMTTWGLKARCWIFELEANDKVKRTAYFGDTAMEHSREEYIDANDERAYFISLFFAKVRGDDALPAVPAALQLPSHGEGSQGGYGGYSYSGYKVEGWD